MTSSNPDPSVQAASRNRAGKRRPSGRPDRSFDLDLATSRILELLGTELHIDITDRVAIGFAASQLYESGNTSGVSTRAWKLVLCIEEIAATQARMLIGRQADGEERLLVDGILHACEQRNALERLARTLDMQRLPPGSPTLGLLRAHAWGLRALAAPYLFVSSMLESRLNAFGSSLPAVSDKKQLAGLRDRLYLLLEQGGLPAPEIAWVMNTDFDDADKALLKRVKHRVSSRLSMLSRKDTGRRGPVSGQ